MADPHATAVAAQPRIATIREELEATFAAREQAYATENYEALIDQVSPSYSASRPDGTTMTREDLATYIRRNLDRWLRIIRQSNVIEQMRMDGENVVVDVRQNVARVQLVEGREAVVESSILQTETWTPTSNGWKLLGVHNEREGWITIDGKPLT